jgi:LmbE family N-acetylglucosaminyl deacetylase
MVRATQSEKMKILYVFPHPDDESFGPAPAIAAQIRNANKVYLLTLTKEVPFEIFGEELENRLNSLTEGL